MAEVIHTIKGNEYLYEHYRDGDTIRSKYIGPVGKGGKVRKAQHGGGAPLKVTQQTGIQKNKEEIVEGKTINNKKGNSSIGTDKPKEKSTMKDEIYINRKNRDFQYVITGKTGQFTQLTQIDESGKIMDGFTVYETDKDIEIKYISPKEINKIESQTAKSMSEKVLVEDDKGNDVWVTRAEAAMKNMR